MGGVHDNYFLLGVRDQKYLETTDVNNQFSKNRRCVNCKEDLCTIVEHQ